MIRLLIIIITSLSLISCGGGGGSSNSSSTPSITSEELSASFSVSSYRGTVPFTVTVDASSSTGATSYSWTFGDGTTGLGARVSKTYTEPGKYTIRLVASKASNIDISTEQVTALDPSLVHSISGTISAPQTSVADSDTADPNMNTSNNNFATAQLLPTPTNVGGYVNADSNVGSTDISDFYRIELSANETINLTTYEYQNNENQNPDLDLYLYDENENGVDSALGNEASESLTVTQSGTYYIEVRAASNSANYLLKAGGSTASQVSKTLSSEFVPGEALYRNKKNVVTASSVSIPDIGTLKMPSTFGEVSASSNNTQHPNTLTGNWTTEQKIKIDTLLWIKALNNSGNYQYAEPNYYRKAFFTPNDELFNAQWHYNNIKLEEALDLETGSNSVIVAVIDTGVLLDHPDLQGQLVSGYDFISDPAFSLDGNGIDNDPNDPGDKSNPDNSSNFHGTHVAGTIAAATNNATGVAGVAGGVRIMPLRVLGRNGAGTSADIIQSLRYAAGLSNNSGTTPAQPANIINLSLGSPSSSLAEQEIYDTLAAMDILVVAAAGNDNTSTPDYPAAYNNVISVSATTINNQKAPYSNFGSTVDIAAPGGDFTSDLNRDGYPDGVLSTIGDDSSGGIQYRYGYSEGTSMASPHVAGVAALMKSANSNLTVAQFNTLLQSGDLTDDLGTPGKDDVFGYGLINARKAMLAATGALNASANIVLSSNSLNFGSFSDNLNITVTDSSGGDLTINSTIPSESWLNITEDTIDGKGFGSYQVSIDRNSLADGLYNASIVFDATNTEDMTSLQETLNVSMQVTTTPNTADAGYIYILAINPENDETLGFTEASSDNGVYSYTIENLEPGEYHVIAGSDFNADNFICDQGDSCGAYPTLGQKSMVSIDSSDRAGIDFTVSFENSISASASSNTRDSDAATPLFHIPRNINTTTVSTPSVVKQ
ncbi:S8 family serine peptidase [Litoribrevibacter albus]|uniref:PKD domain-containing protein n=1 Tax=Litoribrevibacter albus TaxID=1473156 RepID=A0AA37W9H6_9GAMM|nr:S8 family serine peptidase [Litoribrevibacter albus]GLQ33493.1 hypothetical protein GCM10007876_39730 [Litoribrevibacter albus]